MNIITEEMKFRQRLCEFALKNGVTKAARKYQTNRQFVYRQLKKYNGSVRSLALKSRRPYSNPNSHRNDELSLIKRMFKRNGNYGLAEVYVRCKANGYKRSFGSMCRQIRKYKFKVVKKSRKSYVKYTNIKGTYPGEKVQIDIKYVPKECIKFPAYGNKYYQITAIDEYSRKRILKIVKEKSTYETTKFLRSLESNIGFKIKTVQVDNGYEFVNDDQRSQKMSVFEKVANELGMVLKRIRPYSPWQNGKVERSHREDGKILYNRCTFTSEKDLKNKVKKHERRYNKTAKQVLGFKSPEQIISEYFSN